ncbi:MAG: lanthionine synthetase LanC family protein, partial [Bacteroidota bacterium]
ALGMLQPLLKQSSAGFGIGGFNGVPSVCYSLARCADFLAEPSLRERARFFAHRLTPEQIKNDRTFDVLSGSAGAILALLALHDSTGDERCLETAILAGDHLLASRSENAWVTMDNTCLGGFSHGTSGIAPALLKLFERTGNDAYRAAAEAALEWEATLFSPEAENWRDLRGETGFGVSWCHGAPGIALGRFLSLPILDTPRVRADLEVALSTTRKIPLVAKDPPCCGNTGRADILLEAGRHFGRPEWIEASRGILAQCRFLAERDGGFALDGLPRRLSQPSFFTGLAGIGYMFLRQIHPLPCVLALS